MLKDACVRDILPLKGTGEMGTSSRSLKSQVFSLHAWSPVPFVGNWALSSQFAKASLRNGKGSRVRIWLDQFTIEVWPEI
jgi:hypothetical protein